MRRAVYIVCLFALVVPLGCGELADDFPQRGDVEDADTLDAGTDASDTRDVDALDANDAGEDAGQDADVSDPPVYTVEDAMLETCTTGSVQGLSFQLIDKVNCLQPGTFSSFAGAEDIDYSSVVFPYMQVPATEALMNVAAENPGAIYITSALRTLAQQYLLRQWYVRDDRNEACDANLAARPGASNHNGGLAVDIADSAVWREAMRQNDFVDEISSEPWHFDYVGPEGRDVRSLSVRAFQLMWNENNPDDPITVDGLYGPETEGALERTPADGFANPPTCE
jgi:hypothetical protein